MNNLTVDRLRGSLLRCLLLTGLPRHDTAESLTNLIGLPNIVISPQNDVWAPQGLRNHQETTLLDNDDFLSPDKRKELITWWLDKSRGANLPNWDIASTCTIEGKRGLLLIEAKAHDKELSVAGKALSKTINGQLNHIHINAAIEQANYGLNTALSGWALSRDSHYQLSNRFAWTWKLADMGVPVILVYLGFLNAVEMSDQGQPFESRQNWESCIRNHAKSFVPDNAWQKKRQIKGTSVWFLIRSMQLQLIKVD
jgi:hypothetical protein